MCGFLAFFFSLLAFLSTNESKFIGQEPKLLNGFPASLGQFPWQAAVYAKTTDSNDSWFCGGTIIGEEWILTSAFCLDGAASVRVLTGVVALNETGTLSDSDELIWHPNYISETFQNDIGLIKLPKPLTFDENTKSVRLPSGTDFLYADVYITITGWGITTDEALALSPILNYIYLITINNTDCDAIYGIISEGMVCAVSFTNVLRAVCHGDTGGPVVLNPDTDPLLVAIVSFVSDEGCENGAPSGHTRTAYHREWIRDQTGI